MYTLKLFILMNRFTRSTSFLDFCKPDRIVGDYTQTDFDLNGKSQFRGEKRQ